MAYRLIYDTGWMHGSSEFYNLAQLLDGAGLSLEAQQLKYRATPQLPSDNDDVLQLEEPTASSGDAESEVKLGEWYFAAGQLRDAVAVLQRSVGRGAAKLEHPDEALVYLIQAQERLNNLDAARLAVIELGAVPSLDPRLANLWKLYQPL